MEHLEPYKNKKGFTLIETIVVMSIMITLFGISVGVYMGMRQGNKINSDADNMVSVMRLAQNRSLAAREFQKHGVYFDTDNNEYVLFRGETFDSADENNEHTSLDDNVVFLNIQLVGNENTVVFERVTGVTSNHGFIELATVQDPDERRVICIHENGTIERLSQNQDASECHAGDVEHVEANNDSDVINFPSNNAQGDPAQSFVVEGYDFYLAHADLHLERDGAPSDLYLEIRTGSTVGDVVGRSLIVDGESVPESLSWVRFTFPFSIELDAGEDYYMRLRSLPTSNVNNSGAEGSIVWGYSDGSQYAEGSAWRYVGANNIPTAQGENMSGRDFGFRVFAVSAPDISDSRNLEFNLGFSIRNRNNINLSFDGGSVTGAVSISDNMNPSETLFRWSGSFNVNGEEQVVRINSVYIDDNDTILSVYRDRRINTVPLDIDIDGTDLVSYDSDDVPTKGSGIESMVYR